GDAMWIGSTKSPATLTSWTLTSPGIRPPGRAQSTSSGFEVDESSMGSTAFAGTEVLEASGAFGAGVSDDDAQAARAPRATAVTIERTRIMVLVLPNRY